MGAVRASGRFRLSPVVEWILAVAFLCAALAVASFVVQEVQGTAEMDGAATAPAGGPPVLSIPPSVPERAVSVRVLPFQDGKEVRIGDTAADVATRLGRSAESGRQEVDGGPRGERLTRFYEYAGSKFILVFESPERQGDPRVVGIYLVSLIPNP